VRFGTAFKQVCNSVWSGTVELGLVVFGRVRQGKVWFGTAFGQDIEIMKGGEKNGL